MESKIAERRARYESELGSLTTQRWKLQTELKGMDKRIRLIMGAIEEAEVSQRDIDTLQAIIDAQTKAQEESAKPAARKVVDVKPKKK